MKRISIFFVACIVLCNGCKKGIVLPECENPLKFTYPIGIAPISKHMHIGDTLKLKIKFPFKQFNFASGDTINIGKYSRVWLGIRLTKITKTDSSIVEVAARNHFKYYSPNLKFDFTEGIGSAPNTRVRFVLKKQESDFVGEILIVAQQKGMYYLKSMDGIIDDACAFSSLRPYWENYPIDSIMQDWEKIVGRPLNDDELRTPISSWQSDFFFNVY